MRGVDSWGATHVRGERVRGKFLYPLLNVAAVNLKLLQKIKYNKKNYSKKHSKQSVQSYSFSSGWILSQIFKNPPLTL